MIHRGERLTPLPSPLRLFVTMVVSVFVGEVVSTWLWPLLLPSVHGFAAAIADATILTLIIAPLVWWLVVSPLRRVAVSEYMRAATAMECAANGILITDRDGTILWANPAFMKITGYSLEEAVGQNSRILRSGKHDQAFYKEMWGTILSGQVWRGMMVNRRKDGTLYHEAQTISPVLNERREVECFIAIKEDVSARTQAEEALRRSEAQLRQAQKMEAVGSLAGGVAHDFNNLLTAILGYAHILLGRLGEGDPGRQGLLEIVKAGDRAASLTRQLLAFSRKQVLQPKILDLNALATNLEKMLKRLIGEDIELATGLDKNLGQVKADPGQVEQVIMNLVVNSRDAMPNGGKLTIETANVTLGEDYVSRHLGAKPGRYVMLAVADTGAGMDAETQARIFEPFFTTKEAGKGTGLGLAMVYGIIKQSDGYIAVYSEPGHGTTFKMYLPRIDQPVESEMVGQVAPIPRGTETILLVEDDERVRRLTRLILEEQGYAVIEAPSASSALAAAEKDTTPIHLVLTDVVMPEMNGRELSRRLTKIRPSARVLFMSGYTGDTIVRHGVLESGIAFLQKPFTPADLARKVRDALDAAPLPPGA